MPYSRECRGQRLSRPGFFLACGLLGLHLFGLALPAGAQSWPAESGPGSDVLRFGLRQFERLAPPPIETAGRAERAVPDLPRTVMVPNGSVEVGMPALPEPAEASQVAPAPRRPARRQPAARRSPVAVTPVSRSREGELIRELAAQSRRIRELERQVRARRSR